MSERFRQQANHVVEVHSRAQSAVPPRGEVSALTHHSSSLPLGDHAAVHCAADLVEHRDDQRIDVVVEWIAERWSEHDRSRGRGLVMVVHDLREPGAEHDAVHRLRFLLRCEEGVAIVVVPDVFVVEPRQLVGTARPRI
jgi:hypothetical protein